MVAVACAITAHRGAGQQENEGDQSAGDVQAVEAGGQIEHSAGECSPHPNMWFMGCSIAWPRTESDHVPAAEPEHVAALASTRPSGR